MDGMSMIRARRGQISRIGEALGINQSAVSGWKRVPAERVPDVERVTGIPRHLLRPDLWEPPALAAASLGGPACPATDPAGTAEEKSGGVMPAPRQHAFGRGEEFLPPSDQPGKGSSCR